MSKLGRCFHASYTEIPDLALQRILRASPTGWRTWFEWVSQTQDSAYSVRCFGNVRNDYVQMSYLSNFAVPVSVMHWLSVLICLVLCFSGY